MLRKFCTQKKQYSTIILRLRFVSYYVRNVTSFKPNKIIFRNSFHSSTFQTKDVDNNDQLPNCIDVKINTATAANIFDIESITGAENLKLINKLTPSKKIHWLVESFEQESKKIVELQNIIVDEGNIKLFSRNSYDVVINDINDNDLIDIGNDLGIKRLATAVSSSIEYPIKGIMFGRAFRMFIPLVVHKGNKSIHVIFLYDTCSPNTYLRSDTLSALGYKDNLPQEVNVVINDYAIGCGISRGHFENVDLLGQDFMTRANLDVKISYRNLSFYFHSK